jgi:NADPH-dependent 2,4-dienoyl-CoA reductase/sulfur reductase-like enzyme
MVERTVIIGGGAAGMSAASRIKKLRPDMEVTVLEATNLVSHAPCGVPYYIEGLFSDEKLFMTYTPEYFIKERKIDVRTNSKVEELDINSKYAIYYSNNSKGKIEFDYLVIATGAKPKKIPNVEGDRVFYIHHPSEARELREKLWSLNKIAIIGAGFLGIEMAEALSHLGKKVYVIEMFPYVLNRMLDEDMGKIVNEYVQRDVELRLNERVIEVKNEGRVVITDKAKYEVDGTIIAIGVIPNVDLVRGYVKLGVTGAIETNEFMETNVKNVYAAGDVAEVKNIITKKPDWVPFAPAANKMGFVAGSNIGGKKIKFRGVLGTTITKYKDMVVAKTGLTEIEAKKHGFKVVTTGVVRGRTRARYYPGAKDIYIKLIAEEDTLRLLGAQIVGYEEVLGRINTIATAIASNMNAEDLFFVEMGYLPAVATVWDPLIVGARILMRAS